MENRARAQQASVHAAGNSGDVQPKWLEEECAPGLKEGEQREGCLMMIKWRFADRIEYAASSKQQT